MPTIELYATFQALETYVICILLITYRNSGIPLGILASISEKKITATFLNYLKICIEKNNPTLFLL